MEFPKLVSLFLSQMKLRTNSKTVQDWINLQSQSGYTSLHYAAFRGNIDVIKMLIENGATIDICNNEGLNVLHLAAQGNKTSVLIYFIEKYKLDYMKIDNIGSTPLHWASYVGSEESFLYLLTLNPDINKQDVEGLTPLHLAVTSDRTRIIKKLLHKGADKTIRDKQNRTALDLAKEKNKTGIIDMLSYKSCCQVCTVKIPLDKLEKSNQNIVIFVILHFIVEVISVLNIIPCKNHFI
jgi:palmitoyltransferase